ncbi:hypothetical protein [Staphylococcus shinii]|uniref:hypothetical protein n=1 Tax=Staphylococcus shinii TaxID=2912228 RepID=UPI003F5434FB
MKTKTKKQLNLPQLIERAWENKIKNQIIRADKQLMNIQFDEHGDFRTYGFTGIDTIFTVEEEREINEYTRLDNLVVRYRNDDIYIFPQEMIDNFKNDSSVVAFYIPNDDLTMTLIWTKEKGLVE